MARNPRKKSSKQVETLTHDEASRKNIPTAEYQSVMDKEDQSPIQVAYGRRNRDLDPQLVWRGKDEQDWSDLVALAPPLFIQEKVHPKVLIDDLIRRSERDREEAGASGFQVDLFADFNGVPGGDAKTEFYQHDANWTNRMILGDSLQAMASLAEREGLRGEVQCIYIDPPYGVKFNSNFQWSTTSREVTDGRSGHITREPEQVKAFRDTWRDGIHSYLTYLRDRITVARDLLAPSGSLFVQIGDENVHLIKALLVEVLGASNYINTIVIKKKGSTLVTESLFDFILWFARDRQQVKIRKLFSPRRSAEDDTKYNTLIAPDGIMARVGGSGADEIRKLEKEGWRWARVNFPVVSQHPHEKRSRDYVYQGRAKSCGANRQWTFDLPAGMDRLNRAGRLFDGGGRSLGGVVFHDDRPNVCISNLWDDVKGEENPVYVVQTAWRIVQRCILMTTDPGDLVLDPTCGSGTTAFLAEQWGRRWITIDTSRVALALARARVMGARYPFYLLADSRAGQLKEAEVSRTDPSGTPTHGDIRQGFVYERIPHVTLRSIAHNAEIDVIWDRYQDILDPLRTELNDALSQSWEDWDVPREPDPAWPEPVKTLHSEWWKQRITGRGK